MRTLNTTGIIEKKNLFKLALLLDIEALLCIRVTAYICALVHALVSIHRKQISLFFAAAAFLIGSQQPLKPSLRLVRTTLKETV